MSQTLMLVNLTEDTAPPGLVPVSEIPPQGISLDEQIAVRDAFKIDSSITHVFFRRFADYRSSQVAAYIVNDSTGKFTDKELARLHHKLWLSGATPLLYVGRPSQVDVFSCAEGNKRNPKNKLTEWQYEPAEVIRAMAGISNALKDETARRYSSYRLVDGTFWEDPHNTNLVDPHKAAHATLIEKVKITDEQLGGPENPLARRLLLVTIFAKYLEDRGVFACEEQNGKTWFSNFYPEAKTFLNVLESGSIDNVRFMFEELHKKFNGDIFILHETAKDTLTSDLLQKLSRLVGTNLDAHGQLYFWDIYSFASIPVEVISHIYQHFAEEGKGAVFTPPLIVNLLLDQVMPLAELVGAEKVFDPTCGSGIFLVGAFKRLLHAWSAHHNWKRPSPVELKDLLSQTIFGIEAQEEAAGVAAFSLALAICDGLQPNIIWNELRFDKLMGRNLRVGDFQEQAPTLLAEETKGRGFDIIVGNPPFLSSLTPAMEAAAKRRKEHIPDKQVAYFIFTECLHSHLANTGKLCMIQPSGFLYNEKSKKFRQDLFTKYHFDTILDFISIRGLFSGADTKIIAAFVLKSPPPEGHAITHLTFRRTHSAEGLIQFELDYYDYHKVSQKDAEMYYWVWRANLLGGGRLYHLAKRLSVLPTFGEMVSQRDWDMGEGYIAGSSRKGKPQSWLSQMRFLPTSAFTTEGINKSKIGIVPDSVFSHTATPDRYSAPLLLIKENHKLPLVYWDEGDIAYRAQIVGIHANPGQESVLQSVGVQFNKDRRWLQAGCYLLGSRILTAKATALLKAEIECIPWPKDGNWKAAPWEQELVDDIVDNMADYVRLGQDSTLLNQEADHKSIEGYKETFLRILKKTFPNLHASAEGNSDGLRYQAFSFGEGDSTTLLGDDWVQQLRHIIFFENGDAASLRTVRLVRLYDADTLFIVKPNRLRYWIKSTAIYDVDSTLADILESGAPDE